MNLQGTQDILKLTSSFLCGVTSVSPTGANLLTFRMAEYSPHLQGLTCDPALQQERLLWGAAFASSPGTPGDRAAVGVLESAPACLLMAPRICFFHWSLHLLPVSRPYAGSRVPPLTKLCLLCWSSKPVPGCFPSAFSPTCCSHLESCVCLLAQV